MVWKSREKHPPLLSREATPASRWALLVFFLIFGLLADLGSLPAVAFAESRVTHSGFDVAQAHVIASAVARFDRASLPLPSLHIRRSGSNGECTRHGRTADTWPVIYITICEVSEDVVVHELAHAWSFAHLSDTDVIVWNHRRGVPTWLSRHEPWDQRGSEHVADILTWYLYWSDFAINRRRIGGESTPSRFLSDVEWLLENGGGPSALSVYAFRASLINLAYPAAD